jgi:large subunit ribosomal protein L5
MAGKDKRREQGGVDPGAMPPGGDEPASAAPGAVPPGLGEPASAAPGAVPQGLGEPGSADPGAVPRGPQGADEPGSVTPAATPRGPAATPRAKKAPKGKKPPEPEGPPAEPAPRPRLLEYYEQRVRGKLAQQFDFGNPHEIPKLVKIVVNVGMGDAPKNPKALEAAVAELAAITGQRPVVTRAKRAIANFNLREGQAIGCAVTLRGAMMYEFLDRFITIAVPRMRDFRGLPTKSFDGRGNYTLGLKEQMIFPEVDYDKVAEIHGMDITIVTSAGRDDTALALLRELGMPFRGEAPVAAG